MVSGNSKAYTYLPETVAAFPSGKEFLPILEKTGLRNFRLFTLSMGIASIYQAEK
jgi:demethylmenaquinone methyltransferase/2-methoxy-6-polyprenyl-1,4-benzoquinol methylase